nr:cytochrome c1 [uncultured Sphingomonas sp.]
MVRIIAFFVGLVFAGVALVGLVADGIGYFRDPPAPSIEHEFHKEPKALHLASDGFFGSYKDTAQLQRGFQVYKEVCSACHSLHQVAFRDLEALGFNDGQIKNIASSWAIEVPTVNPDTGEPATRKATPADKFPNPYANEVAARAANNNALPPDLSLIVKAREGHGAYVYSLLTGYADPNTYKNEKGEPLPAANKPGTGLHFNPYFANLNLAMPAPLTADGQVTYAEGNPPATVDQMAKDVTAFLTWASEPNLARRHSYGLAVMVFMLFATVLGFMAYKNVWAGVKGGHAEPEVEAPKAKRSRSKKTA